MVTKQSCDHSSAKIMPTVQEKAKKEIIASLRALNRSKWLRWVLARGGGLSRSLPVGKGRAQPEGVFRTQIKTPIW